MSLILLKPPAQADQSMDGDESGILRPGGQPPFVSPHCRQCGIPVERFTIDATDSWWGLGIQWECHGKTSGKRFMAEQLFHHRRTGEPLWVP